MTQITMKTNEKEANEVWTGKRRHIIRSKKDAPKEGEWMKFQLYKDRRPVYHQVSKKTFLVTIVEDYLTAPIAKDAVLISFM